MSIDSGAEFLRLHQRQGTFVLPNVWDAGSAKVMARAGFPALATTSAGIAFAAGMPDDGRMARDDALARIAEIVAAVELPVSADLQEGLAPDAAGVGETIRRAIAFGVVGANIEDADPRDGGRLFDLDDAAERIAAARRAADAEGVAFTLNARTDPFLAGVDDPLAVAVERAARYVAAGADCVFVPGVADAPTIAELVGAIDAPLNVVAGLRGEPLGVSELQRLGVRRISIGGSLARACLGLVQRAAQELLDGRFDFTSGAIPHADANRIMAG